MSVTVLIPARYGSTRFPGKPLAMIHHKPMIQHVYERAKQAKLVDEVYVATDDELIKDTVEKFGGKVVMTSEKAASGTDRIDDAAARLGLVDDDLIINVQGDQPLIDPKSIDKVAELFQASPGDFEMATLAYRITNLDELDDPMHVKMVFDKNFYALYFSRSCIPFNRDGDEDYPVYKHLGVYGYTRRFVNAFGKWPVSHLENLEKLEQLRVLEFGERIKVAIVEDDSPEVDTLEDIRKCEEVLSRLD